MNSAESLLARAVLAFCGQSPSEEEGEFLNGWREFDNEIAEWDKDRSPRSPFWQEIARGLRGERKRFAKSTTGLLQELVPRDGFKPGGQKPEFAEFWNEHKYRVARRGIVTSVSGGSDERGLLKICEQRVIEGLLDDKCIQLAVGAFTGVMYSHFYNEGNPRKVRESDAADVRHATVASVAEVFVTHDKNLYRRLSALRIRDLRVLYL